MKKFNLTMLALNIVVLLLGLICSGAGVVNYVAAQDLPAMVLSLAATTTPPTSSSMAKLETISKTEDSRSEYYRGIFDICMASGRSSLAPVEKVGEACRDFVRLAIEQKWFETPSEEWKWPLPAKWSNFEQGG